MQDRHLHADRGDARLVARASGQGIGDQVKDVAGHLSIRGGPASDVLDEAAQRAHRRIPSPASHRAAPRPHRHRRGQADRRLHVQFKADPALILTR